MITAEHAPPALLKPGETVELWYRLQAPTHVNLTSDYNRIAYGHWSAVYERGGQSNLAHRAVRIALAE
jgi:hypothetical protein